jgi:hypothetical protein
MRRTMTILAMAAAATSLAACGRKAETPAQAAPAATPAFVVPAAATTADPAPALPAWSTGWLGKPLAAVFPKVATCRGNTDWVTLRYTGEPAGVQVRGWAFDPAAKRHVEKVVLVSEGVIAGAGSGGLSRPRVMAKVPEVTDPDTQWFAVLPKATGYAQVYGVISPDTVCTLGHISF